MKHWYEYYNGDYFYTEREQSEYRKRNITDF